MEKSPNKKLLYEMLVENLCPLKNIGIKTPNLHPLKPDIHYSFLIK